MEVSQAQPPVPPEEALPPPQSHEQGPLGAPFRQ